MTRVLVLYGTTDGHTRQVADAISEALALGGLDTTVIEAGTMEPQLRGYAGTIVAASVHAGRYQKDVEHWVRAHAAELTSQPSAFVSVSLAVLAKSNPKTTADLDAVVARFLATTGWRPTAVKHVAGALLYTRYGIFKRWMMKRIVARSGGATDTSKDYDYTDWADLRAFANEFRRRIPGRRRDDDGRPDAAAGHRPYLAQQISHVSPSGGSTRILLSTNVIPGASKAARSAA